jgi:DNA-binding FrmR family transcriptional regulator
MFCWRGVREGMNAVRVDLKYLLGVYSSLTREELMAAPGYADTKGVVQRRLRRIEGQVRGLQNMVEGDRYCIDVLDQISAVTRALQAVALELLGDHISHCVHAVKQGGAEKDAKVAEANAAIARLVRA